MPRLRVASFSISADGFGAGPDQSLADPLGRGGPTLHRWAFETRTLRRMFGQEGGGDGIDERYAADGMAGNGAWILGRHMFTHERGPWANEDWTGWWGDVPPYHCPVFVLTHHPRRSFDLGGTTFHFVTDGFAAAVAAAKDAAGEQDVRLGGGVATLRQGFEAGLIDEAHIAVSPVLLGSGEALFAGLDLPSLGYGIAKAEYGEDALHLTIRRDAVPGDGAA